MAKFIRDMAAEFKGSPDIIGAEAEVVILVPKRTAVTIVAGGTELRSTTNADTYLVKGGPSRVYKTDPEGRPVGEAVPCLISVTVHGVHYTGTDLAAPEELDLTV